MKFSQLAHEKSASLWLSSKNHPFIKGIEDGTLPLSAFKAYLIQDNYYVKNYLAIYDKILATSQDSQVIGALKSGIQAITAYDVDQQNGIYQGLNMTNDEIQQAEILPTTYHYTCHMHHAFDSYGEVHALAALLPCPWLYLEIFQEMLARKDYLKGTQQIYIDFVNSYADETFQGYVHEMIQLLDDLVNKHQDELDMDLLLQQFMYSSAEELRFWQMTLLPEKWDSYTSAQSK